MSAPPKARPWWMAPGPVAFASLILLACGGLAWQGIAAARRPVDVVQRNNTLVRTGSFCDAPGTPGTAAPLSPPADPPGK